MTVNKRSEHTLMHLFMDGELFLGFLWKVLQYFSCDPMYCNNPDATTALRMLIKHSHFHLSVTHYDLNVVDGIYS